MERLAISCIAHHHKNNFAQLYCNHCCICYHSVIQSMRLVDRGAREMGNTARTRWAKKHLAGRYEHDQIVEMAVSELNAQIDLGHEFPDSCLLVAGKYGITTGELTMAYDDQF